MARDPDRILGDPVRVPAREGVARVDGRDEGLDRRDVRGLRVDPELEREARQEQRDQEQRHADRSDPEMDEREEDPERQEEEDVQDLPLEVRLPDPERGDLLLQADVANKPCPFYQARIPESLFPEKCHASVSINRLMFIVFQPMNL